MTADERVKAVAEFGFTERQARFLVTVMLHSGVCLLRQYTAFAGIVHGQKTRKFFAKLVRRKYATAYPCRHNRGRVYHVHHKPLYRAIGQTESSHRRPMAAARVVDSLALLDAMLATPSVVWLALPEDKTVHLSSLPGVGADEANRVTRAEGAHETARAVRDRMPIGIDPDGRWVLVYVVAGDQIEDFHWFVQRHAPVVAALPAWTLRVVFSSDLRWLAERYNEAAQSELDSLRPEVVTHIRWYFKMRRTHTLEHAPIDDQEGYDEAHYAFKATRFQVLYRRWLREGDTAFDAISSGAAGDAIKRGAGRVECHVLPFSYRHLSPLVGSTRPQTKGAEEGDEAPTRSRPPLSPSTPLWTRRRTSTPKRSGGDAKRLCGGQLAGASRVSPRGEGRRSLPPDNSSVGTAIGA